MRRFFGASGVVVLWSAILSSAPPTTAIVGARLIDGTGAPPIPDSVVIVDGAADLVLLDADPTADINNPITIRRVMRAGRWVD